MRECWITWNSPRSTTSQRMSCDGQPSLLWSSFQTITTLNIRSSITRTSTMAPKAPKTPRIPRSRWFNGQKALLREQFALMPLPDNPMAEFVDEFNRLSSLRFGSKHIKRSESAIRPRIQRIRAEAQPEWSGM